MKFNQLPIDDYKREMEGYRISFDLGSGDRSAYWWGIWEVIGRGMVPGARDWTAWDGESVSGHLKNWTDEDRRKWLEGDWI